MKVVRGTDSYAQGDTLGQGDCGSYGCDRVSVQKTRTGSVDTTRVVLSSNNQKGGPLKNEGREKREPLKKAIETRKIRLR